MLDHALEFDQALRFDGNQHHVFDRLRNQACADRADGAGAADDHGLALRQIGGAHLDDSLLGRFQGRGDGQAVAAGNGNIALVRGGDAGIANHRGECPQPHDACAHALGHLGRLHQFLIGEILIAAHHFARGGAQRDQIAFDLLAGGGRLPAGDLAHVHGRNFGRDWLHDFIGQVLRPAKSLVLVNEANVEWMNHKGKLVEARFFRLQVTHARRPLQIGHQVKVRVFVQGCVGVAPRGHQATFED